MSQYNLRNPAVKRLMREAEELKNPTEEYYAHPLEDNLFEWHFTLRGPQNTEFEGGIYHGRITLPPDYPMKPPSIILLTPNGRFETNKKICLSISGHHPETWQPSWSIRTALLAIIGFLPTHGNGAIGSLDYTPEERKKLAKKSQDWNCSECGPIKNTLKHSNLDCNETFVEAADCVTDIQYQVSGSNSKTTSDTPNIASEEICANENDCVLTGNACNHSRDLVSSENVQDQSVSNVRLRHVIPPETTSNSVKTDELRPASNYCSLVVIWLISVVLLLLVARRWFCF